MLQMFCVNEERASSLLFSFKEHFDVWDYEAEIDRSVNETNN